ncbi:MAG: hypothetical protein ACLGIC_05935 [Acidimicrobiia bacterium]
MAVEQAVQVSQAVGAVAGEEAQAHRPQLDPGERPGVGARRRHGRLVDQRRAAAAVAGGPRPVAVDQGGQALDLAEAVAAALEQLAELVVDGPQRRQGDGVRLSHLGVARRAGDAAFGHGTGSLGCQRRERGSRRSDPPPTLRRGSDSDRRAQSPQWRCSRNGSPSLW